MDKRGDIQAAVVLSNFHLSSDPRLVPLGEPPEKFKLENNQEPG